MELYGTVTSPYTRIVRIVALELGFDLPLTIMKWRETPRDLFAVNPAGRIPLLLDGARRIGESRAISAYLTEHDGARPGDGFRPLRGPERWDEENLLGIVYAAIDAHVVVRVLNEPPAATHPYMERSRERIGHCFAALDDLAARGYLVEPEGFGMAEAALITAADVIAGRGTTDIAMYANVDAIRSRFGDRPSVVATATSPP